MGLPALGCRRAHLGLVRQVRCRHEKADAEVPMAWVVGIVAVRRHLPQLAHQAQMVRQVGGYGKGNTGNEDA